MRLLISTGEVSGDLQGSLLVKALKEEASKRLINIEILAFGGKRMKEAGAILLADTSAIGAIGFWEAIPFIFPTLKAQSTMDSLLKDKQLDAVILIDYMGPNIRLGNKIKNHFPNIPIIYYIAPQEWAWRLGEGGTTDLIGFTDKILAIFQKEAEFYAGRGGNVSWVGHPMLDTLTNLPDREKSLLTLGLSTNQKILLLFPASRSQELRYVMPTLAKAAALLQKRDPSLYVIVPSGLKDFEAPLQDALDKYGVKGRVLPSNKVDEMKPILFSIADLALAKSGTINMELALNKVPQIVGYKVSRVTAFLARYLLRFDVDHISPVNLLLKERLIPELLQDEFTVESIFNLSIDLLENAVLRTEMKEGYNRLLIHLGEPGVTDRAAKEIFDLV